MASTEFVVGIYVRISADPKGQALGVQRQEKEARAYARRRWPGRKLRFTAYVDNDVSATKGTTRPQYAVALAAIEAGEIGALVVWAYDRLCRRLADLEVFLSLIEAHPIEVGCVSGDLDLATPMGRTLARVISAIAAGEVETMKWRIRAKQKELAEAGKVGNGGRRPYGYTSRRDQIVKAESVIICEIAGRILAGESMGGIARDLNDRGVAPAYARAWSTTTVRAVVTKAHLAGLRVYQGVIVGDATWPAILDRGTWEAVCAVAANPARDTPGSNARRHLLSGLATCGLCAATVGINLGGSGGRPLVPRYRCTGCARVSKNQTHLDDYVIGAVIGRLTDPNNAPAPPADGPVVHVATEAAALTERRRQTVDKWADLGMDEHDLARSLMRIDTRLEELRQTRQRIQAPHVLEGLTGVTRETFDALPLDRRRAVVAATVSVVVQPANRRGAGFDATSVEVSPVSPRVGALGR